MHKIEDLLYLLKFFFINLFSLKSQNKITLNYANAHIARDGYYRGGRAKLNFLKKKFKQEENFKYLYLVSSALPNFVYLFVYLAKLFKKKIILNQNGVAYPGWTSNHQKINKKLRYVYENSDYIIFQSKFCKLSAIKWLSKKKISHSIVYNPIKIRKKQNLNNKNFNLIVCGSHENKQRVFLALSLLKILIDKKQVFKLIIAGPLVWENAQKEVYKFIKDNNLKKNVILFGKYKQNQLSKLYFGKSILLHLKYNDPSPTVPLEAQSFGVPVICSGSGGMRELLTNNSAEIIRIKRTWINNIYPKQYEIMNAVIKIKKNYRKYSLSSFKNSRRFDVINWIKFHEIIFKIIK